MFRVAINDRILVCSTALLLLAAARPAIAQQPRITPPPKRRKTKLQQDYFQAMEKVMEKTHDWSLRPIYSGPYQE